MSGDNFALAAAEIERLFYRIIGNPFGKEISFANEERGCAAHNGGIFLLDLSDERNKARVVGNVLEWAACRRLRIHSGVCLGHFFQKVERFCVVADGCVVHGQIEEGGWIVGRGGQNFLKCLHLLFCFGRYRRLRLPLFLCDRGIERCDQEKVSTQSNSVRDLHGSSPAFPYWHTAPRSGSDADGCDVAAMKKAR